MVNVEMNSKKPNIKYLKKKKGASYVKLNETQYKSIAKYYKCIMPVVARCVLLP